MNTTKLSRLFLALVATLMLALVPRLNADPVLTILQPLYITGLDDTYGWQSFTVPGAVSQLLTTFAVRSNSGAWTNGSQPGIMKLFSGQGTGGDLLDTVSFNIFQDNAPYGGFFYQGDFGGRSLTPGQYTVAFSGTPYPLDFLASDLDPYSGGEYVGEYWGNIEGVGMYDLTFFTPGIGLGTSSAVPEPSSFAMLGIGGLLVGGYAWRKKQQTA
ncbi:MAG: PEP-CTERM sorting domain-containing protein [Verrucomicrobiota bacterium]